MKKNQLPRPPNRQTNNSTGSRESSCINRNLHQYFAFEHINKFLNWCPLSLFICHEESQGNYCSFWLILCSKSKHPPVKRFFRKARNHEWKESKVPLFQGDNAILSLSVNTLLLRFIIYDLSYSFVQTRTLIFHVNVAPGGFRNYLRSHALTQKYPFRPLGFFFPHPNR